MLELKLNETLQLAGQTLKVVAEVERTKGNLTYYQADNLTTAGQKVFIINKARPVIVDEETATGEVTKVEKYDLSQFSCKKGDWFVINFPVLEFPIILPSYENAKFSIINNRGIPAESLPKGMERIHIPRSQRATLKGARQSSTSFVDQTLSNISPVFGFSSSSVLDAGKELKDNTVTFVPRDSEQHYSILKLEEGKKYKDYYNTDRDSSVKDCPVYFLIAGRAFTLKMHHSTLKSDLLKSCKLLNGLFKKLHFIEPYLMPEITYVSGNDINSAEFQILPEFLELLSTNMKFLTQHTKPVYANKLHALEKQLKEKLASTAENSSNVEMGSVQETKKRRREDDKDIPKPNRPLSPRRL